MDIVIITGGSRGIGQASAIECARRGMGVILTYNSHPAGAQETLEQIRALGGVAHALPLDVGRTEQFADFSAQVWRLLDSQWGRRDFDYLVNNAGFGAFNRIEDVTPAQFDSLFNVHLKGPFFLTQALLPMLRSGGAIVNLSSATVRAATVGVAPYAAFKSALETLTRYMAEEFGDRRIRVNAVAPGAVLTDLADGVLKKNPEFAAQLAAQTALGRVGQPEDVARVIAALLGQDGGWVNGQTIDVSGGYRL